MDYKETLPVRSFTQLALLLLLPPPLPPPFQDWRLWPWKQTAKCVLSTCNVGSCLRSLAKFTKKCIYDGKRELKHFFWKKDYSFQQLEKRFSFRFLCDHNRQRKMCRSFHFSSSYQPPGKKPFNRLSIVCDYCCLLFTHALKVGDIVCYGYLFHIVFH